MHYRGPVTGVQIAFESWAKMTEEVERRARYMFYLTLLNTFYDPVLIRASQQGLDAPDWLPDREAEVHSDQFEVMDMLVCSLIWKRSENELLQRLPAKHWAHLKGAILFNWTIVQSQIPTSYKRMFKQAHTKKNTLLKVIQHFGKYIYSLSFSGRKSFSR